MRSCSAATGLALAASLFCLAGCGASSTRPEGPFDLAPAEGQAAPLSGSAELRNGGPQNSNPALNGVMRDSGTAGIPSDALPGSGIPASAPGSGN